MMDCVHVAQDINPFYFQGLFLTAPYEQPDVLEYQGI